ncbi:MAG: BrnA antitoxin family protein [Terracidiphilus sp.]
MKKTQSETDWDRVLAYKESDPIPYEPEDGPYDPNDAEATRAWFAQADLIRKGRVVRRGARGPQRAPTKKLVSLRLSPEVLAHFKAEGPGWQTRIDGALLKVIKKRA